MTTEDNTPPPADASAEPAPAEPVTVDVTADPMMVQVVFNGDQTTIMHRGPSREIK